MNKEILKRLEEIEAQARDLLDRLRKLEKVAEAARELVNKPAYRPELQDRWHTAWSKLREALAALEEGTDD